MINTESFDEEELSQLYKQALFVQQPPRLIDKNTVPADGHEFIFKSRLEDAALEFPMWESKEKSLQEQPSTEVDYNEWVGKRFYPLFKEMKANRKMLVNRFKKTEMIPLKNEEDCCKFCLGSESGSIIYENLQSQPSKAAHVPLLSFVIHLENSDIVLLLTYLKKWLGIVGFTVEICQWTFALLFCLTRPLSDEDEDVLEDIYDCIKIRMKDCDKDELCRLQLIAAILLKSYCVKAYTLSPHFMF